MSENFSSYGNEKSLKRLFLKSYARKFKKNSNQFCKIVMKNSGNISAYNLLREL